MLIACVLAVGSVFIAVRSTEKKGPSEEDLRAAIVQIASSEKKTFDEDADGLKNWEEELWKSNPADADTDDDGTTDGMEVAEGRNPAVAGPNDDMKSTVKASTAATSTEKLSTTDVFSRQVFSTYLQSKYNLQGEELSQEDIGRIVNASLSSNVLMIQPKLYAVSELKIGAADDAEAKRAYGNALGAALKARSPKGLESGYVIFAKSLQAQDEKKLEDLDRIVAGYTKLIGDYLKMEIPKSATMHHLNFVNSLSAVAEDFKAMRNIYSDPVRAYAGLNDFKNTSGNLAQALMDLEMYLVTGGVMYEPQEDGYLIISIL